MHFSATSSPPARLTDGSLRRLKSPATLQAFAERHLAPVRKQGGKLYCQCPAREHEKQYHCEIQLNEQEGVWYCQACKTGGSIIQLAALLWSLDPRADFPEICRRIAATTSTPIEETSAPRRAASLPATTATTATTAAPAKHQVQELTDEEQAIVAKCAASCRAMAAAYPDKLDAHAAELGISPAVLALAPVGLSERGHLCYLYPSGIKERGIIDEAATKAAGETRFLPYYLFRRSWFKSDIPATVRFAWAAGRPCGHLWGELDAERDAVIITEGESDSLAVQTMIAGAMEAAQTGLDEGEPYTPSAAFPDVLALPSAASTVRHEEAARLAGRTVIIIADNDGPGQDSARELRDILARAGVTRIFVWTPPSGKDFRTFYLSATTGDDCISDYSLFADFLANLQNLA